MHVAASTGRMVAGRYLLHSTIGRGAMGTVWRARDTVLARDVAVKEVRLRGPVTADSVITEETRVLYQRTLREARTAARLNHPAVVTVFDVIETDGSPWIVMELVEARSLDQVLTEDGPLRPPEVAELGTRLLGALACAHAAGILHRDVKPSNVLLGPDGRAVLTDFGIATLEGDSGLTQAGMVMGTPGFTAPERIRGDLASPASDLWSLGATLYAAVEGRGPFDHRGNSIAILAAIANEEAPRPRSAGPLRPAIEALLHRNPLARPDAAAAGRLLAAAGTSAAVWAPSPAEPGPRPAGTRIPLPTAPLDVAAAGAGTAGSPPGRHGAPAPHLHHRLVGELADLLPRGRRGLLILLGAVAIVGAGLLVGLTVARGNGASPPAGAPRPQAVTTGQAGSRAGFTMTVPAGWRTAQQGAGTDFTSPAGRVSMRITPAAASGVTGRGPVRRPASQARREDSLPGYEPIGGRPFSFQGGTGMAWQFSWQPASGERMEVLDITFRLTTPAGHPGYLVRESAPAAGWAAARPVFRTALRTFRVRA